MRLHCIRPVWILVVLCANVCAAWAQDNVVLGVLEDVPGVYFGEANSWHVRTVFHKTKDGWQAYSTKCGNPACLKSIVAEYPAEVVWTIGFDGKILGQVTAQTPEDFKFYGHTGLQDITAGTVPSVGQRSSEFGGFTGDKVYRPLVANSHQFFKDPDLWKPAPKSDDLSKLLRDQFRNKFPRVLNCRSPEENVGRVWHYQDENIKIVKAYFSNKGWFIASVHLAEYRCDGPYDDAFVDQWFIVSPEHQVTFLGAGMMLVDAGDYDNDGKSELLFSIDGDNRGGYKLFYDNFRKSVAFKFFYH